MPRKPRYIKIQTHEIKNYILYLKYNIFELADTLKFFKRKGISIIFEQSDEEIELYLDDKIDKIPMNNE